MMKSHLLALIAMVLAAGFGKAMAQPADRSLAECETPAPTVIAELEGEGVFGRPIVTEVSPLTVFYPGEAYHQQYFRRNPDKGYCQAMIAPKVSKLRAKFTELLRPDPPSR